MAAAIQKQEMDRRIKEAMKSDATPWTDVRVSVPNVVGMQIKDASQRLELAELTVGIITQVRQSGKPSGQVLAQSVKAGSEVLPWTEVNLSVAQFYEGDLVQVPSYVGKQWEEARFDLNSLGLTPARVFQPAPGHEKEVVRDDATNPPGKLVEPGTTITLVVGMS